MIASHGVCAGSFVFVAGGFVFTRVAVVIFMDEKTMCPAVTSVVFRGVVAAIAFGFVVVELGFDVVDLCDQVVDSRDECAFSAGVG